MANRRVKFELGHFNGHDYHLVYDKFSNQQVCEGAIENKWAWFLEVDDEYVGNFDTRRLAMACILMKVKVVHGHRG